MTCDTGSSCRDLACIYHFSWNHISKISIFLCTQTADMSYCCVWTNSVDWHPNGWTSSARLALSRIAFRWNNYVVQTVATVFPYLCLKRKSFYLSNTERRPDVLLRRLNECNLEQFEASGHEREFRRKVLVVQMDVAWLMNVLMEYHVIQTDAKDLNFTVLNFAQSLLEAHNWNVDSEYNNIPN